TCESDDLPALVEQEVGQVESLVRGPLVDGPHDDEDSEDSGDDSVDLVAGFLLHFLLSSQKVFALRRRCISRTMSASGETAPSTCVPMRFWRLVMEPGPSRPSALMPRRV